MQSYKKSRAYRSPVVLRYRHACVTKACIAVVVKKEVRQGLQRPQPAERSVSALVGGILELDVLGDDGVTDVRRVPLRLAQLRRKKPARATTHNHRQVCSRAVTLSARASLYLESP